MTKLPLLTRGRLQKAAYLPILATAMILMFARLLIFAKILDVSSFAELNTALIFSGIVGMLSGLGLYLDLQRKLPGYFARGLKRSAAASIQRAMFATAFIGIFGLAVTMLASLFGSKSASLILLGIIHGVCQQAFLIQTMESRSSGDPIRFALQNIVRSSGIMLFSIPILVKFDTAFSVLITECIVTSVLVIAISRQSNSRLGVGQRQAMYLAIKSFKYIDWRSVSTLLMLSLVVTFSISIDRWLASFVLSKVEFAQYSFASIIMTAAFAVQALVSASVFPMIATKFAVHGTLHAYKLSRLTSLGVLSVFFVATIPALFFANATINTFYPKYKAAIEIVPIFIFSAAFRVSDFWTSFLIISGKERTSLIINVIGVILGFGVWFSGFFGELASIKGLGMMVLSIAFFTYVVSFLYSHMLYRSTNIACLNGR